MQTKQNQRQTSLLSSFRLSLIALAVAGSASVSAAPIILEGDFIRTQISDDGTLGNDGDSPGLMHDRTGTGTFDTNFDYLRPGTPFEGFGFRSNEASVDERNSSNGGSLSSGAWTGVALTDLSGTGFDNRVTWSGIFGDAFEMVHDFFFNDDDENLGITTTITALNDLTNVSFSRAIDPDPDNNFLPGSTPSTDNVRGLDLNDDGDFDDDGEQAPEDYVSATGRVSDSTIAMFTSSDIIHNSGIVNSCCSVTDPSDYLGGGDFSSSTGDDGIGLGFNIGDLALGESVALTYFYVFGDTPESVDIPDDDDDTTTGVPSPAPALLIALGLLGLRRRSQKN